MSHIYCLYSTEDGEPRYVAQTEEDVSYCFKGHVTSALEKKSGPLYDWMRQVWRKGFEVEFRLLQQDISPKDSGMFEQYWIKQFANLLNTAGDSKNAQSDTELANQIKTAIRAKLSNHKDKI